MKANLIKKAVMISLLGLAVSAQAAIQETQNMAQIVPYLNDDTLLVFDLDNTVIEPAQTVGSDQWYKSLLASGYPAPLAVSLFEQVQRVTKVSAVEAMTPEIIAEAQARGLKVMALTARPVDLAPTTEKQLLSLGVDFSRSPVYESDVADSTPGALNLYHGIGLIGPTASKGDELVKFLNKINLHPKRVVFVDDTAKHDQTVNAALDAAGIENYEFRYGFDDKKVQGFNGTIAALELQTFQLCGGELISDKAAAAVQASGRFSCP